MDEEYRHLHGTAGDGGGPVERHAQAEHTALCLSGGGVRSASFGLGVLQGLAQAGLLGKFDYLSTVSGGGYIGAWLSAWRLRARLGHEPDAADELGARAEPEPVARLRDDIKFLDPRSGWRSADTWTLGGTILRNLLVTWLVLIPLIALGARQQRPASVAFQQMSYWSTVPYHHGPADVVKYAAFACAGNNAAPLGSGVNCLQDEIVRHVNDDPQMSCFDFSLQLLDTERMTYWGRRRQASFWIENASVEWKESEAPFHTVGRLTLVPKSVFPSEACAAMWIDVSSNSAPDCKPVGGINRARPVAERASRNARLGPTPPD